MLVKRGVFYIVAKSCRGNAFSATPRPDGVYIKRETRNIGPIPEGAIVGGEEITHRADAK